MSLTTLSAPRVQPPVGGTGVVLAASPAAATPASRVNGITPAGGGARGGSRAKAPANGSRFVRGSPMSVMGRTRSAGAGNSCSNGDMHSAAAAGDAERVGEHLRSGGDVDVRDGRQWSLLHHGECSMIALYLLATASSLCADKIDVAGSPINRPCPGRILSWWIPHDHLRSLSKQPIVSASERESLEGKSVR